MTMSTQDLRPDVQVASIAATGRVRETPCGSGRMTWHDFGAGPPLVLLHGGMGSWMHWIRNIPPLGARHRLLVPDIPGHLDSAVPDGPYAPGNVAAVLSDGLRVLIGTAEPYCLAGFSFGSVIAGHLAQRDGARVARLILVSPSGLGLPRGATGEVRKWRHLADPAERLAAHRNNLQASMISDPAHVDALAVYIHAHSTERAKPVSAPISLGDTMRSCLPQVVAPIAAIWGAQDPAAAPYMSERRDFFHAIQPDAPLVVIAEASHWVQYEAAERFNAVLADLCAGGAGRPRPYAVGWPGR